MHSEVLKFINPSLPYKLNKYRGIPCVTLNVGEREAFHLTVQGGDLILYCIDPVFNTEANNPYIAFSMKLPDNPTNLDCALFASFVYTSTSLYRDEFFKDYLKTRALYHNKKLVGVLLIVGKVSYMIDSVTYRSIMHGIKVPKVLAIDFMPKQKMVMQGDMIYAKEELEGKIKPITISSIDERDKALAFRAYILDVLKMI